MTENNTNSEAPDKKPTGKVQKLELGNEKLSVFRAYVGGVKNPDALARCLGVIAPEEGRQP